MDMILLARWLHILGAAVLLGTGAGIAFFMLIAHRTGDSRLIAHVASTVVVADFLFTASAIVLQPLTGFWLVYLLQWPLDSFWIVASTVLYIMVGLFWLPVVWMQIRMRDLARSARDASLPLPPAYHRLYRLWFISGFPAFAGVLAIIWLMLARPL